MFSWTFAVAPLAAAPRLLKGRSVGKALPHFLYLLRTANARQRRAHQSDASARIFCVLRRVFWSPQGHLVGDAASGRACILCAPARSKERGASPQNLRTSAPFVARHCLCPRSTFYRSLKYGNYRFRGTSQYENSLKAAESTERSSCGEIFR